MAAVTEDCAVCFEPLSTRIELPCACNVGYCSTCWDRSLAQSYKACGQARCPSCRVAVRADFDAERCQLRFSRDDVAVGLGNCGLQRDGPAPELQATTSFRALQARRRLVEQAQPAQIRLLRDYGLAHPLSEQHTAPLQLVASCAQACAAGNRPWPRCVCGSQLERVDGRERMRQVLRRQFPMLPEGLPDFERLLANAYQDACAFRCMAECDLCGTRVPPEQCVWTCSNGDSTILHTNAYDVCDSCFARHGYNVVTVEPEPAMDYMQDTSSTASVTSGDEDM